MRLVISIILTACIAGIAEWYAPWWAAALVAGIVGLYQHSTAKAFLVGFCGIALLWLCVALWRDIPNEHLLSGRMSQLFKLPSGIWFILVTTILGGIVGGLSAWSSAHLKRLLHSKQE